MLSAGVSENFKPSGVQEASKAITNIFTYFWRMDLYGLQERIFSLAGNNFDAAALEVFRFQSQHCEVYRAYLGHLGIDSTKITQTSAIPYLPIEFFKQFEVRTGTFFEEAVFSSSSTSGIGVSRHFVKDLSLYTSAFSHSFDTLVGDHTAYCHLALLPSYLEREGSSLITQVAHFIRHSRHPHSGFYLHNTDELCERLVKNEEQQVPTLLWGVTFALMDFVEKYTIPLRSTMVIETGGMKGRRKEITRAELHELLKQKFSIETIGGEYGMTELMSQAYALRDGIYHTPKWMRVTAREVNDPLGKPVTGRHGVLNIIDLANLYSCAFIATSDLGIVHAGGSFEVQGRMDYSDTRGCNLLVQS